MAQPNIHNLYYEQATLDLDCQTSSLSSSVEGKVSKTRAQGNSTNAPDRINIAP